MDTTKARLWIALLLIGLGAPAAGWAQDTLGTFAIGRGGAAAKAAVDVQHQLRQLAASTGNFQPVDLQQLLEPDGEPERAQAVEEAVALLEKGKQAYEQLELDDAQAKFDLALKKFEYGYGYLEHVGPLTETLMFLGASWVLVGEPDKGKKLFMRAADLPGRKTLNAELFPPNIQEIFDQAQEEGQASRQAKATLITVPQGASLFVDDVYRGGSPLKVTDLRPGVHLVRAIKDGFKPFGGKIVVSAKRAKRLRLKLKPATRRKAFSAPFRKMTAEVIKANPGTGTQEMAKFLGAGRMTIVVLEGEAAAMTARGYACAIDPDLRCKDVREVLDITSPGYADSLKAFLVKLLQTSPTDEFADDGGKGEGYDEGAAAAAALLAKGEGDEGEGDMGTQLGLDLADGGEGDKPAGEGDQVAPADDVKAEQDREKAEADKVVKDAAKPDDRQDDQAFAFTWTYLHDKWWFWTAVGVVAAGAATGAYFGATAGSGSGGSGGQLVLGLH